MPNIRTKLQQLHLRAVTVLDALVTLVLVSFVSLHLSAGIQSALVQTEETLFFMGFEQLYQDSQELALASRQPVYFQITNQEIRNGFQELALPSTIQPREVASIRFDPDGGNSSLAKVVFQAQGHQVHYQLYLGSGRYKKSNH